MNMNTLRMATAMLACIASPLVLGAGGSVPDNVAYVTNQGGGVSVLDLATLKPAGEVAVGKDPRGIGITPNGRWLLTANQGTADVSVIDTRQLKETKRIPVGKNVEFLRVSADGKLAFVTYEPSSTGKPPAAGHKEADDDATPAEVAVIDLQKGAVVARMKASPETEGIEFSPDHKRMVVTNEGTDTIGVYDLATYKLQKTINISSHGSRPRGIKLSPDGRTYVVTLENSDNFLVLDADLKVIKSVSTEKGPYGVAFDREGRTIWVAASRGNKLQVFDAASLAPLAAIPVGKRCWHFSFTPDEQKVLLACGRSDSVLVIDAKDYKVLDTLEGYKLPWGVVTYPKSDGSLDTAKTTGK
ncbi:MAG: beta-propeller fold lactonase family protein [Rhodocyclaceae bacterium]|nr:beta-propeller fold lactonase family protein [Rhodocyclaceae bacterium]MBX3669566.1 beta-propeller fold lactonase family protein [Rhodocyclaceae bacterium]